MIQCRLLASDIFTFFIDETGILVIFTFGV